MRDVLHVFQPEMVTQVENVRFDNINLFISIIGVTGKPTRGPNLTNAQFALEPSPCETAARVTSGLFIATW